MKHFSQWIACGAMVTLTSMAIGQGATTNTIVQAARPVAVIEGKTVTTDELTSFSELVESLEGKMLAGPGALLDEYVLTRLYDKISTSSASAKSPFLYQSLTGRSLLKRELGRSIREAVDVPRVEMEKWYEKNLERYTRPERVRAYHMFMEISQDEESSSPLKVRERMEKAKAEADTGTSFSEVVRKYSEAASSENGGEIGEITRRMPIGPLNKPMNLKLEDEFFALPAGKVSDIIDTSHGLHLLYVSERQTTATPTLDEMITSGILPAAIAQDYATSETQKLLADTAARLKAEIVAGSGSTTITDESVAYRIGDSEVKVSDLLNMYGERFKRFYERARSGPAAGLQDLMKQAMDDELLVRAAVERGLDKNPALVDQLKGLEERGKAEAAINSTLTDRFAVQDEQVRAEYEKVKDTLRLPEAEGELLKISARESSGTAETARAREKARLLAEELENKILAGKSLEEVARGADTDDATVTYHTVPRHISGRSTDTLARGFDQAAAGIASDGGLSKVVPAGTEYILARRTKKHEGDPIPYEEIAPRLRAQLEQQEQAEGRKKLVEELVAKGLVKYLEAASEYERGTADSATSDTLTTTGSAQKN